MKLLKQLLLDSLLLQTLQLLRNGILKASPQASANN